MRLIVFISLLFLLSKCSSGVLSDTFPINIVKSNSQSEVDSIYLERLALVEFKRIDTSFVKKWFTNKEISCSANSDVEVRGFDKWYYIDYREFDGKVIFGIANVTYLESIDLYYLTYDIKDKKLKSINCIAQSGGDGGFYTNNIISWQKDHSVKVTNFSHEDSIVTLFNFSGSDLKGKVLFSASNNGHKGNK